MINKLKKWLSGDANWKAEQELDQFGKKDTFLADAMEGYRSMPEGDHVGAVNDLKAKLKVHPKAKIKGSKGGTISWKTFAAAASLIGVVGLFIWTQNSFDSKGEIAETRQPSESQIPAKGAPIEELKKSYEDQTTTAFDQASDAESEVPEIVAFEDNNNASGTIYGNTVEPADNKPRVDPSNIEAGIIEEDDLYVVDGVPVSKNNNTEWDVDETTSGRIASNEKAKEVIVASPAPAPADAGYVITDPSSPKAKKESVENLAKENTETRKYESDAVVASTYSIELLNLKGTVLDLTSENVLIGANVYLKGTGEGVVTDVEGNFSIESTEPLPWTLGISYVGYTDIEVVVNNLDDPLQIKLDDSDISLEEVVVTSSRSKDKSKSSAASVEEPKPVKGLRKYKRYIRRNLKYPSIAKQNKIQGGVTVRFYIDDQGKPTEAKVINSLGSGCDAEAIRLIEEGPEWVPRNVWAMYTVVFEL